MDYKDALRIMVKTYFEFDAQHKDEHTVGAADVPGLPISQGFIEWLDTQNEGLAVFNLRWKPAARFLTRNAKATMTDPWLQFENPTDGWKIFK